MTLERRLRDAFARLADSVRGRPRPPPKPRRSRRRAKARDFQRARVYRWEAAHVFPQPGAAEPLSLEGCRGLVEAVFRWAEDPPPGAAWSPPRVTDGRGRRHACGSREVIKLPRWARTRAVVLHECAHGLAYDMHGPRFVAAYVGLLEEFAGLEADGLRASLAAAKVAVAPPPRRAALASAGIAARTAARAPQDPAAGARADACDSGA